MAEHAGFGSSDYLAHQDYDQENPDANEETGLIGVTPETPLLKKKENKDKLHNNTEKRVVYTPPTGLQLRANGHFWVEETRWNEFVQHRKDIKKPLTDLSVKKSLALLSQFKNRQREIVDASIRNGWQGLFPPKGQQYQQPQKEIRYNNPAEDREKWKI